MTGLPTQPCPTLGCWPDENPHPLCPEHTAATRIPCDFTDRHHPHLHGLNGYFCDGHPHRVPSTLLGVVDPPGAP